MLGVVVVDVGARAVGVADAVGRSAEVPGAGPAGGTPTSQSVPLLGPVLAHPAGRAAAASKFSSSSGGGSFWTRAKYRAASPPLGTLVRVLMPVPEAAMSAFPCQTGQPEPGHSRGRCRSPGRRPFPPWLVQAKSNCPGVAALSSKEVKAEVSPMISVTEKLR